MQILNHKVPIEEYQGIELQRLVQKPITSTRASKNSRNRKEKRSTSVGKQKFSNEITISLAMFNLPI